MTSIFPRVIALLLSTLCCPFVAAQQMQLAQAGEERTLKNLSLEQLGQIEVTTTSKEPVPARRIAAATFVLTQEDIRRSGATSIPEALRLVPGVEVARMSSDTWAIGIRGLQSNFSKSVLVLIDGRSVYTPLFAGVYWDLQEVVLEDVDRIEVIRGPGATIWGPNAVNGVINIITRNAAETQGAMVSLGVGSNDKTIDSVRYGGAIGDAFHYRVFGKGLARSAQFHLDGNDFDDWHQERGGFRTDWKRGRDSIMTQGGLYRGDSPHLVGTTVSDDSVSGGDLVVRWRRDINDHSDVYLQTYVDRTVRIGSSVGETRNTFDLDFLHHVKVGPRNEISYGGGLRFSPDHVDSRQAGVSVLPNDQLDVEHSLFAQDEIHFANDRVALTVGSKLEYNNYTGWDAQPSARVLWAPNDRQSFWTSFTRAVTTPSRIEEGFLLEGGTPALTIRVRGNPNFKSESLMGWEGGYRQLFTSKFLVDVAVFHNDYDNLQSFSGTQLSIEGTPPKPVATIQYSNDIEGATDGVEIAPAWQVLPTWRLSGYYAFVTFDLHANAPTSDISSTGSVPTYQGSTPHHEALFQSTLNLPAGLEFDTIYRYASHLPAQKVESYQTIDARLGWKFRSRLELSLVGQNLLQPHHYEWGTGDPTQQLVGIRRAIFAKLVWRR